MFFDTVSDLMSNAGAIPLNSVAPDATVIEAVRLMNRKAIGAVLVVNSNGLAGILTERDVIRKIVATGRNSTITPVHEVITPDPQTVRTGESAVQALDLMARGDFLHLPVTEGKTIHGVLSIRDLNRWLTSELKTQVEAALMAVKTMSIARGARNSMPSLAALLTPNAGVNQSLIKSLRRTP